jgi:hypothetical protein
MLSASGEVLVNGAKVDHSATVFAGDSIETGRASAATLTQDGSQVMIMDQSRIAMGGVLQVAGGSAVVNTKHQLKSMVGDVTVAPGSSSAVYKVLRAGNQVQILAVRGDLMLSEGSVNRRLSQGSMITMALPQNGQNGSTASVQQSGGAAGAAAGVGSDQNGGGAGLSAGVIAAIAANVGVSILVPLISSASAASPVTP